MNQTEQQYQAAAATCESVFVQKTQDYGTAWRILRTSSLTDQLFIKAKRIRSLETNAEQKIDEGVDSEYIGLINYSAMALIQIELGDSLEMEIDPDVVKGLYQTQIAKTKELMMAKNLSLIHI